MRAAAEWILTEQRPSDLVLYLPTQFEFGLRWYLLERPGAAGPPDVAADPSTSAIEVGHHLSPQRTPAAAAAALERADRVWTAGLPSANLGYGVNNELGAIVHGCWTLQARREFGLVVVVGQAPARRRRSPRS